MLLQFGLLGLIFSSFVANGDPLDLTGSWHPSGEIRTSHRIEMVIQRVYSDKHREELQSLQNDGFTCVYARSNTYRCRKAVHGGWDIPDSHKARMNQRFAEESFEFVHMGGEPSLITEGDSLRQWELPYIAYNKYGKTNEVIYWELIDHRTGRIQFEIEGRQYWPHFLKTNEILCFREVLAETKGNRITEYWYDVTFVRK